MRHTTAGLVRASHPGPTALVTTLAASLLVGLGAPLVTLLTATAAVLAGQLSVGWSNDLIDAGRDRQVGRVAKPVVAGAVSIRQLRVAAGAAAAGCVALSLATGPIAGGVHVLAVAAAWAYNVWLKSTVLSWLPYAVSFGLLPVFLVLTLPGEPRPAAWVPVTGALLGVGAHLVNVLPDMADDEVTGVRGLPHRLGRTATGVLAPVVLAVAASMAAVGPVDGVEDLGVARAAGWAFSVGLALVAGAVGVVRTRSAAPFRIAMAVAAVCVVLLVSAGPLMRAT